MEHAVVKVFRGCNTRSLNLDVENFINEHYEEGYIVSNVNSFALPTQSDSDVCVVVTMIKDSEE